MKKQTKLFLLATAAILLTLGAFQYLGGSKSNPGLANFPQRNILQQEDETVSVAPQKKNETVTIDFGNGRKIAGETATQSAYQALLQVAKANNLTVESKQYKYGIMVTKVGDFLGSADAGWMYSVNGKPGQIAADRYVIYPGDKVDWEYKKFN